MTVPTNTTISKRTGKGAQAGEHKSNGGVPEGKNQGETDGVRFLGEWR